MSLHTRYRPLNFDEVIGQDQAVSSLQRVCKDNRAHAFIFTGPAGVGKTTLARILANQFVGSKATVANIEEIPAAHNTGVEDMRRLVERSMYRALGSSQVKCFILDEAHRLSGAAWDELLKPIEEPPQHVYWLFCTTNPGKIPKTIQTRCLRYELKPVKEELIYELLQAVAEAEGIGIGKDVLEAITEGSGGSPRQALVYLEACAHAQSAAQAQSIIRSAAQSKEAVDLARWLISGRARSWAEAMKYVSALNGTDAESVRIMLCNYFAKALEGTKDDKKARQLLALIEPFTGTVYNSSDGMVPLMCSIGLALNLDQ